tara:strand:+ start:9146 stop:11260 length:2115 start_codon:yes stop_codon:yes gene_type:complete
LKISLDLFSKKLPGFSFIDAIYGLTIILCIVGVIYGSINSILRNHRKAQLITHADRLSQMIMQEVKNREFDENIDSFPETPLTTNIDFGTDEGEDNLIDFDDVDDFNNYEFTDDVIEGLRARVSVNYALIDTSNNQIGITAITSTLKRVKIDVIHDEFSNLMTYTGIVGSNISPNELTLPPYATEILINKEPGLHVVTAPSSLIFDIIMNEPVYVDNSNPDFSLYIDFDGFVLNGLEGSFTVEPSEIGELRAYYFPGDIDPTLTEKDTLRFSIALPDNITSRNMTDFLTYRPRLVLENGKIENLQRKEAVLDLPLANSENSFLSYTQILPILPAIETKIFTESEAENFNTTISDTIREDLTQILASWPRSWDKTYYPDPSLIPEGSNALKFALAPNGKTINSTVNYHFGTIALISPDSIKLTEYTFEAILQSDNDDDGIGFIIAFQPNRHLKCNIEGIVQNSNHQDHTACTTTSGGVDAENYFLVVWRTGRGTSATGGGSHQFAVTYGEGINVMNGSNPSVFREGSNSYENFIHDRKQISGDVAKNWNSKQWTKIKVERTGELGENIIVYATRFLNTQLEAQNTDYDINNSITIDLTSDPRYHKFLGPSQYGYIVWSNDRANWHDTKLVTSTVVRKDVAIMIGNEGDNREIQQFQRANDEGVFQATMVELLRNYIGYSRKLVNTETNREFLILENSIIVYPWNE